MSLDKHEISRWLFQSASRLTNSRSLPVPILSLVSYFDVDVVFKKAASENRRREGILAEKDGRFLIYIYKSDLNRDISPRESFTLAHELAHLLLIRRYGWRSETTSQRHLQERLCNHFAGWLLVPQAFVKKFRPESARQVASAAQSIAGACHVSLEVASRRLAEEVRGIAVFEAVEDTNSVKERVWRVLWCGSSIENYEFGRGKHITRDMLLWDKILLFNKAWSTSPDLNDFQLEGVSTLSISNRSHQKIPNSILVALHQ